MKKRIMKLLAAMILITILFSGAVLADGTNSAIISEFINSMMIRIGAIFDVHNNQAVNAIDSETEDIIGNINAYNANYEDSVAAGLSEYKESYTNQKLQELRAIQNEYIQEMDSRKQSILDSYSADLKSNIDKEYQKALDKMLKELTKTN